ncbi:MAG: phosphotransferase, partial [Actinomycetota bacterium]
VSQRFARSALARAIACVAIAPPSPDLTVPPALLERAFGPGVEVVAVHDANGGRGVFSRVLRVTLAWPTTSHRTPGRPDTVVVKVPVAGPNGEAARAAGAYRREALAYTDVLPTSPVATPRVHLVTTDDRGGADLVLEDLGALRAVDQLDGLAPADAVAVATALRDFHRHWRERPELAQLDVRRTTPAVLDPGALAQGLVALRQRWDHDDIRPWWPTFDRLVERRSALVARFAAAGRPTLCHGDPRADNLVFGTDGSPVLFDWQQLAVQVGEADLAWLAATSLTVDDRRRLDDTLVEAYGGTTDHYRVGLVLPGLAVLLLAQRQLDDERAERFVATSLARIGAAVTDLDVPGLADGAVW